MSSEKRVLIVGAGWAGVAAALELHAHSIPVTLLESAGRPGGRARTVEVDGTLFDNGQHLLIGAYHETLRLLSQMGIREADVLERRPLRLEVRDTQRNLTITAPPLPAPLHLLWALLGASGLNWHEKYRAIRMSLSLNLRKFRIPKDISVAELLSRHDQGADIIRRFWEPLCLATLNTPISIASAQVFLRVLQDSFTQSRHDADLLLSRVPLGELFCESAMRYLEAAPHNAIALGQRVTGISVSGGVATGITTGDGAIDASEIIIATSPSAAARLLEPIAQTASLAQSIASLGTQPIATVYLYYPDAPPQQEPMLGLSGTLSQWLFDRSHCGQPGWYAVVISAQGEHLHWDKQRLAQQVQQELANTLPNWPAAAERTVVIREKRATFECRVDIESHRPGNRTPLSGLWLAGDYTSTGYPATLEGAVRSGVQCAHEIIAQRQSVY